MLASIAGVVLLTPAAAGASSDCVTVTHDLRSGEYATHFNDTGSVVSSQDNTDVTITDATGFVRIESVNNNGYCTNLIVDIPSSMVSVSELGDVDAEAGADVTAQWTAQQDLSTGEHYTRVIIDLPAGAETTHAPSDARIISLAWTDSAKDTANSIQDRVTSWFDDGLEQNQYTVTAPGNGSDRVTVSLTDPNGSRTVQSWHAMYRTNETGWSPVGTDADAPVYYTESGDSVEFAFNDPAAEVRFTANPDALDQVQYRIDSYVSGWQEIADAFGGLPFASVKTGAISGVLPV